MTKHSDEHTPSIKATVKLLSSFIPEGENTASFEECIMNRGSHRVYKVTITEVTS